MKRLEGWPQGLLEAWVKQMEMQERQCRMKHPDCSCWVKYRTLAAQGRAELNRRERINGAQPAGI